MPSTDPSDAAPSARVRKWLRMAIYLLIIIVAWAAFVWFLQRSVMFPRYMIPPAGEAQLPPRGELWELETPAGIVEAWFLPGDEVEADRPGPVVVFAHGNGELIDFWPGELGQYRRMGVSVLLPEYRGYGRSAGRPSQRAITEDFVAFYDRLIEHPKVDPERIVYHGRSVGNGALAALAEHRPPAAFICESSFTSAADLARRFLVPRVLMRDPFEVQDVLAEFAGPVLLLHGTADEVIPVRHARRLHETTPQSELALYDGVTHNEPMPAGRYWADIERFLGEHEFVATAAATEPDANTQSE